MDWEKAKAEYVAGGTSYKKLADKYGITVSKLQRHATREGWPELRAKAEAKADSKMVEAISTDTVKKAIKISNVADKLLEKILEMLNCGEWTAQNIKHLTSALKDIKEIKGEKSKIDIREQEARIKKLQKEVQEDNTTSEIKVSFSSEDGEESKWAE